MADTPDCTGGTLNIRMDNDLFGSLGQDQGYTNGLMFNWTTPNLGDFQTSPCLPGVVRGVNRYLSWLQPDSYDAQNMAFGLEHLIFTPEDKSRSDLIKDDRPFAGALLLSMGYNTRSGDSLYATQYQLGIVGPAAQARQVQDGLHRILGGERFHGWKHQLHNEPIFQMMHERRTRVLRNAKPHDWGWDLQYRWGGGLGNFTTYAGVGAEWRFGWGVPDDFGTSPLRPASEGTAPMLSKPSGDWSGHLFVAVDARWVLRDITLDGNTFRSSHSVHKRPFVADIGYGLAVYRGDWRFTLARYHRTREFDGQKEKPVYGIITLSKRF